MQIDKDGRVGIGTTSPSAMLHIRGTDPFIRFTDTVDETHYAHMGLSDTSIFVLDSDADNSHADSAIEFKVDNSSVMFLKNGGSVGIGTITPFDAVSGTGGLHVKTSSAYVGLLERSTGGNVDLEFKNGNGSMFCGLTSGATGFAVDDDAALNSGPMLFVEKSTGNVGVNSSAPTEKLFVNGNIKATGEIVAEGSLKLSTTGNAALIISADTDSGSADETDTRNLIDFNVDGDLVGNIFYQEDVNRFEFNTNDATPNITRIGCGNGDAKRVQLNSDTFQVLGTRSPASNATGEAGQIAWDTNYVYVCTATNTWKRAALTGGY